MSPGALSDPFIPPPPPTYLVEHFGRALPNISLNYINTYPLPVVVAT